MFGVAAADAVYVGDRLHTDAIGAARAPGCAGCGSTATGSRPPAERAEAAAAGDPALIRSLAELPALLA